MVACGVQRLFSIDKGLPPNRGGAAAGLWQEANTPSEVLPRDPGVARDHDLCTELISMIISIIPPIVAVVRSTILIITPEGLSRAIENAKKVTDGNVRAALARIHRIRPTLPARVCARLRPLTARRARSPRVRVHGRAPL